MSRPKYLIVLSVTVVVGLVSCYLLTTIDIDLYFKYSHRVPLVPTAQAQYKEILDKISSATNDELLKDDATEMPRLYSQSGGCIAAQGSRTFGTNRLPEDVEIDYSRAFSLWVFQSDETPAGFKMIGTGTKTTGVQVIFVDPISPDFSIGKGKYQTIYRVQIVYADPVRDGCFG